MDDYFGLRRVMPLSRLLPPLSCRVFGNCLSGVGCRVPYDGLTHGDLAGGEVADAIGSPRVVRVDAEYDALGPAWRLRMLKFGSPQVSAGFKRDEVIKHWPVSDPEFVKRDTGVEGGCRTTL